MVDSGMADINDIVIVSIIYHVTHIELPVVFSPAFLYTLTCTYKIVHSYYVVIV